MTWDDERPSAGASLSTRAVACTARLVRGIRGVVREGLLARGHDRAGEVELSMTHRKRGPYRKWPEWTPQQDSTLRVLWRQDRYDHEIGVTLGRSRHDVGHRRRALGMSGVKYRGHTPEVREKIRAADHERWANPDIAARMLRGLKKGRTTWKATPPAERRQSI